MFVAKSNSIVLLPAVAVGRDDGVHGVCYPAVASRALVTM